MINISKLLDSVPKTTIQPRQSNLQGILSLIARMSDQSRSAPEPPSVIDGLGSGIGAGFAKGADMAVSHMMSKDLQTSAQDFQAGENKLNREFTQGENKLNREFTAGENALNREQTTTENALNRKQRASEFAAEQTYRNNRLKLEQDLADQNYELNILKYFDESDKTEASIKASDAQTRLAQAQAARLEAVDPKELARLDKLEAEARLTTAQTNLKASEVKLKELEQSLGGIKPEEVEKVKKQDFSGIPQERAQTIQQLLVQSAQINSLNEKDRKAMVDAAQRTIAQGFIDPTLPPESYVNSIGIIRNEGISTTTEMDSKESNARTAIGARIQKDLKTLPIDFEPENYAKIATTLNDLNLTNLDDRKKSDIENKIFTKLVDNIVRSQPLAPQSETLSNILEMNRLKINRGYKPLVPNLKDIKGLNGKTIGQEITGFREGTPEELTKILNQMRGINAP